MDDRTVLGYDKEGTPIYIGSRVHSAYDYDDWNYGKIQKLTGTVIGGDGWGIVFISWDGLDTGHSCDGRLTNKSGWNMHHSCIVVLPDQMTDPDPVAPPDLTGAFWL